MEDLLYTVKEVSEILKTNVAFVYSLINKGLLPALKLRSLKVRKKSLLEFLEKYDGKDLNNLDNIKDLDPNEVITKIKNGKEVIKDKIKRE